MGRVSIKASKEIRGSFSGWFQHVLKQSEMNVSAIAYASRRFSTLPSTNFQDDDDLAEISYSNLKQVLSGEAAPSAKTVLRIVRILSQDKRFKPSTLPALDASHKHVIARIVMGLDSIALDGWKLSRGGNEWSDEDWRAQRQVGVQGYKAIQSMPDMSLINNEQRAHLAPSRKALNWERKLITHPRLLAVAIAYRYFNNDLGWERETAVLDVLFSRFDPALEQLIAEALGRYETFTVVHGAIEPLERAEELLRDYSIDTFGRHMIVSPLFESWANDIAPDFVIRVPLFRWVDSDTIRHSLPK